MTAFRFAVIVAIAVVAGVFVAISFYSAPDDPTSGADIAETQGEETLVSDDSVPHADFSAEADLQERPTSDEESRPQEVSGQPMDVSGTEASFDRYMSSPSADAEAYVFVNGAMDTSRLDELAAPAAFDDFARTLETQADTKSRETAEEYRTALFEAANASGLSVTVDSVSCGTSVCTAKIHSLDTEVLDQYLTSLQSSEQVPMYATMEMPAEAAGGFDVRRIVFTTDPAASAFEYTVE